MKIILGITASLVLLIPIVMYSQVSGADYTVPSTEPIKIPKSIKEKIQKDRDDKLPKHAKANMSYKLSMKNKYMKIKTQTGIQIDLPDSKKSNEKVKFDTPAGKKILTKSQGTKNKQVGIKTEYLKP